MVNVLVTGSNGRLAKIVIKKLKKRGHKVIPFDRLDTLESLIPKEIDVILNIAGTYSNDPVETIKDNVIFANNMLRLCVAKECRILLIGSMSILYKLTNYSFSKAILNMLANEYIGLGIDVKIINPPEIWFKDDNILSKIKKNSDKVQTIDNLDFEYVDANDLANSIVLYVETNKINVKYKGHNLQKLCKKVKNTIPGVDKSFVVHDKYGVILKYGK